MKLLIIVPSTSRGGVEEYSLKIANQSMQVGWEVGFGLSSQKRDKVFSGRCQETRHSISQITDCRN